ncbi:hypothetical protein PHLGIDRAFT_285565 [Phlebiopsis gigantea 11061_1 CR5-6]|uniref:Uncharacterized protein n=1 Tax=Phlebiopsis gigantea (strain 11061_1 CR5-6) TaxID=745531 RepID=A0A0C3NDK8_PHLG1|nr:hypothetical protein PHLGIDRAFT_285565 [Phlebiopsis gigantea 11061_1 CR5-6]
MVCDGCLDSLVPLRHPRFKLAPAAWSLRADSRGTGLGPSVSRRTPFDRRPNRLTFPTAPKQRRKPILCSHQPLPRQHHRTRSTRMVMLCTTLYDERRPRKPLTEHTSSPGCYRQTCLLINFYCCRVCFDN